MIRRCVAICGAFVGGWVLSARTARNRAAWAELGGYSRGAVDAARWYAEMLTPPSTRGRL